MATPVAQTDQILGLIAGCLESAGTARFYEKFLELAGEAIGADQCMVFSFRTGEPSCYLSYNVESQQYGRSLAGDYVESGYQSDPLVEALLDVQARDQVTVFRLADIRKKMRPTYIKKYFADPGIVDKISLAARGHGEALMINFYRLSARGEFGNDQQGLTDEFWNVIGQSILLHYSIDEDSALKSPLASLSKRESDVCRGILAGQTTEAIASDLDITPNSVATYRKRAYLKLGIHSKSALFALCQQ